MAKKDPFQYSDPGESLDAAPLVLPPTKRTKDASMAAVDDAVDTAFGAASGMQWKGAGGYAYSYNPKTKAVTIMVDPTGRASGKTLTQGSAYDAIVAEGMKKGVVPLPSPAEVVASTTKPNPLPGAATEKPMNFSPGAPLADASVPIGSAKVGPPAPLPKAPPASKPAPGSAPAAAAVTPAPPPQEPMPSAPAPAAPAASAAKPAPDAAAQPMPSAQTAPNSWAEWYKGIRRPATTIAADK